MDDITKNTDADVTFSQAIKDGTATRIGFVKTGAGTFVLDSTASTFSGDVIVSNGTLRLGTGSGQYAVNYLGNLNVARTITVEDGGTLDFPHRFQNGDYGTVYESAPIPTSFRIKTGGTLRHSLASQAVNTYGDLWLDGGALEMGLGQIGCGNLLVRGTMKFSGETAYEISLKGRACAQALNGSPATVFDVADITGDAAPDVTYGMALMVSGGFCDNVGTESNKRFVPKSGLKFGFVKRGAGTMRLTYNLDDASSGWGGLGTPNGDVVVEAGTLQVDNTALADYADSSATFVVKDGACLSGTGMVRTVSIEQGGGFSATIGEARSLRLIGTATLPAKGVVRLSNPVVGESIRANLMTVADGATVTGIENLANWDVYVDGALKSDMKVFLAKGVLQVKELRGLSVIFR